MLKEYLEIGKIVGTHGVKGEMRLEPWADSPAFLKRFKKLYYDDKGEKSIDVVCRPHGNIVLVKAKGIETVEQAQALRNKVLFMKREDAKLEKGDYFIQDLIGCEVFDTATDVCYGKISEVSQTGANDVWHIRNENGKEYLIPAIPLVIQSVDVEDGNIKITALKGIFDDED
ncbi:MAG: ribosome maturation factor RimM [Clostridiales bacterium]|nr:ribosome maturation factor RimM [Clostridiales bacterium]